MGYAERHRRTLWARVWAAKGLERIQVLWLFLRKPWTRQALRGGSLWGWATKRDEAAVQEARLRAIAGRLTTVAQLEALLAHIEDAGQRSLLRTRLRALMRDAGGV